MSDGALNVLIGCHIAAGIGAVLTGAAAMLSRKGPGKHPRNGRRYLLFLAALFSTGTLIATTNWQHLWHLFALGAAAAALATMGYAARRSRWRSRLPMHILGMAGSYIALLTAFYVDNGPRLPVWRLLPTVVFWFLPAAIGAPVLAWTLLHRRRQRQT